LPLYTECNKIIVDQVSRFEDIAVGLQKLGRKKCMGDEVAEVFSTIGAKSNTRPNSARPSAVLSPEDIHFIGLLAEREIRALSYEPPSGAQK